MKWAIICLLHRPYGPIYTSNAGFGRGFETVEIGKLTELGSVRRKPFNARTLRKCLSPVW